MPKKKWNYQAVENIYTLPLLQLLFKAQSVHRRHHRVNEVELCKLLSIKTGACPEDCAYCSQSGHYKTGLKKEKLVDLEVVRQHALLAKKNGATRYCMGAAWRNPSEKDFPKVVEMIKVVKSIGLETCVTLGQLTNKQANQLKENGLDFYNHNLDTSPDYYKRIISTRTFEDRLDTLAHVRSSGLKVCCGGIIGMGESQKDRIELLIQLANLPTYPESVPINSLIPIEGTPLAKTSKLDNFEFIRTVATARILMPKAMVRLSAGRENMSDEMQALCFMAGANSLWLGEKLLTATNPDIDRDRNLFQKLGFKKATEKLASEVC